MRDNSWLQLLLDEVWESAFADIEQANIVRIEFGRRAKNRLGSIRIDPRDPEVSIITINGLFRLEAVPEEVVRATIAHELIHYAHGFNSPHHQRFRHPHAGGVMRAEYRERGLERMYLDQRRWLKESWAAIVSSNLGVNSRRVSKISSVKVPRPFWIRGE
jgi:hypothetical protein